MIRITDTYKDERCSDLQTGNAEGCGASRGGLAGDRLDGAERRRSPAIPAETWERITKAARELGYTPNRFAQALKTNRTMTIACIVPDITNPFYPALMRGIQSITDGLNYDVIAVNTDGSAERERHFLDWSRQGRVDGVIGVFFTLRASDFRPLVEAGVPVVRIESSKKRGGDIADRRHLRRQPRGGLRGDANISSAAATSASPWSPARGGPQGVRIEGYRHGADRGRRHAARRARRGRSRRAAASAPPKPCSPAAMRRRRSLPPTT